MQLRNLDKLSNVKQPTNVRTVDANDRGAMGLQSWLNSIEEFHKADLPFCCLSRPNAVSRDTHTSLAARIRESTQTYKKPPLHRLDMSFTDNSKLILYVLNFAVYIDSVNNFLRLLFSLHSAFKEHPHFKDLDLGDLLSDQRSLTSLFAISSSILISRRFS
ncbi:hypothetical protein BLNAU_24805 [Blattamonas nauphoetae]|uniref:Uncharacterized protein n=1 Tax=Blattamonas nauphoetae TaxID=2049346 RepID=A0ABQ9WLF6_9EUKA|nr:hypothetical protein BLNAU_24805 [Blattamonas nauphoetae]